VLERAVPDSDDDGAAQADASSTFDTGSELRDVLDKTMALVRVCGG
jgi:hypothetical protein